MQISLMSRVSFVFPQNIEMLSVPDIFPPLLSFQSLEEFPVFPVFLRKKKKSGKKKLFDKDGPKHRHLQHLGVRGRVAFRVSFLVTNAK